MILSELKITLKRNKVLYYVKNLFRQLIPNKFYQQRLHSILSNSSNHVDSTILDRLNYYNKLNTQVIIDENIKPISTLKIFQSPKSYNFDIFEYIRYFDQNLKANFIFGDITYIPNTPSILKSRPISENNQNSVLLKLDKKRHFVFITDKIKFRDKKNVLIGRGAMTQPHRIKFMEMYFNHPFCDLGHVSKKDNKNPWLKPKMSISEHLKFKFILSLEGNDVATNLKWIMSSNSIAVMPKPKFETWFMEGRLIGDYHYIEIKDDYSDLEEKLNYYMRNEIESEAIINNANKFVKQFQDRKKEDLLSLLVLDKYFKYTSQSIG